MRLNHGYTSKKSPVARKASSATKITSKEHTRSDYWTQVAANRGCDPAEGIHARYFFESGAEIAAAEDMTTAKIALLRTE